MSRIFISYRRGPGEKVAFKLADRIRRKFGGRRYVFLDRDVLEPGDLWPERILDAIGTCEVVIPIIGPGWPEDFARRDRADDWVFREIDEALKKNRVAAQDEHKLPVLFIPVLVGGAAMPRKQDLPEALHELLEHQGEMVVIEEEKDVPEDPEEAENLENAAIGAAFDRIWPPIDHHLGDAPTGRIGFEFFSLPPRMANSDGFKFRYRAVRNRADLAPFVKFSDGDNSIALRNKELKGPKRQELYEDWCEWTKDREDLPWDHPENRVRSFLILDRATVTRDDWEPIGVSIILPLSDRGKDFLTRPSAIKGEAKASNLREAHLRSHGSSCILLDTLIIAPKFPGHKFKGRESVPRVQHHNWGTFLPLRHLAEYWRPHPEAGPDEPRTTFLVEPDNYRIDDALAHDLGFYKIERDEDSGPILVLDYPPTQRRDDERFINDLAALIDNLLKHGQIDIE